MKLSSKTMKLSEKTLNILKNFSSINQSILVKQGNQLRTISVAKNILAEAEIKEDFPRDFAIYDLNQFLNGLSLHQDPEMDFSQTLMLTFVRVNVGSNIFMPIQMLLFLLLKKQFNFQQKIFVFNWIV